MGYELMEANGDDHRFALAINPARSPDQDPAVRNEAADGSPRKKRRISRSPLGLGVWKTPVLEACFCPNRQSDCSKASARAVKLLNPKEMTDVLICRKPS